MNKDIYIIKNDINNKVYIGQATNTKERFQKHCVPSAAILNNSYISKAIQKYGKEHFWYEILESQIENYNEKEIEYIKLYNCKVPNGYNLSDGGENPPALSGTEHPESCLTQEQVEQLTKDLINTNMSMSQLAIKYNFMSKTSISEFNKGKTYYRENIQYPIRKNIKIGKLEESQVDLIIYYLKNTKRSYINIAKEFNVEYKTISRIDKGIFYKRNNIIYPIRNRNEGK